jgi:dTDP-4-dehydrorhamnose reductase
MRVLIAGSLGMLGSDLTAAFGANHDVVGLDLPQLDITDADQIRTVTGEIKPDIIINSAAMTDVDGCEADEKKALRVNGYGAGNLASAAAEARALFVHYSTDYVFDGSKMGAYTENDPASPLNAYGRSKLLAEELIPCCCQNFLILRTSWLFGRNGKNFVRTILNAAREKRSLRVVNDQRGCPTYTLDLASQTVRMVEAGCRGVYHVTNSGSCTWYQLAAGAVEWAKIEGVPVSPVTTAEFPRPAKRPANSVLANARLEREGIALIRPWPIAVREYINSL